MVLLEMHDGFDPALFINQKKRCKRGEYVPRMARTESVHADACDVRSNLHAICNNAGLGCEEYGIGKEIGVGKIAWLGLLLGALA